MLVIIRGASGPLAGAACSMAVVWTLQQCFGTVRYLAAHPADPAGYVIAGAYACLAVVAARVAIAGLAFTAGTIVSALPGRYPGRAARLFALAARSAPLLAKYAFIGLTGVSAVGCSGAGPDPARETSQQTIVDPGWSSTHGDTQPRHTTRGSGTSHHRAHQPANRAQPGRPNTQRPTAHAGTVIVRPADTLWSIAEASLPAEATRSEVAAEWPRWYRINREVIGDNPDLLLPGQRLHGPAS